jgi:glycosyltransferase involved in cell wall biosynthesis
MGDPKPRHLLHVFPTFAIGGSQIRFGQLVALHGERYRHTVISLDGNTAMAARLPQGAPVIQACVSMNRGSLILDVRQAVRLLDQFKPDLLVTYNWGSMEWWLAKKCRSFLPHVHVEDGFGADERFHQFRRRKIIRRLLLNDPNTITVLPSTTLLNIAHNDWRLRESRLQYIPNGVAWRRFGKSLGRPKHDGVVIGTVATLRREKNIARLIALFNRAASLRPDVTLELIIVGDGAELELLKQKAQESKFGKKITFMGASNFPEQHLANMDLFALTSDTEQMPLSILEAMASSLPIVSFDVGDVAQMVSGENIKAASIPRNNDDAYVKSLLEFIDNSALRETVGNQNLQVVKERFSLTAMAASYAALFN